MLRRVEGDGLGVLLDGLVVVLGLEGFVAFGLGGFGGHLCFVALQLSLCRFAALLLV